MNTTADDGLPRYGAVHVVSDLHLGGFEEGGRSYRIFREAKALAWLIREGLPEPAQGRRCLVLNGDIVDFLAHQQPTYFDWQHAVDKLNDALNDKEQQIVWQALQDYVCNDAGDLVLVLGNHDLELALPGPQQVLLHFLTRGQPALRGRIILALDGAGFSCRVVGAQDSPRVLCLHGNEADPWNAIDYGRLSLIRRALARGSQVRNAQALNQWVPNPGTQLVIEYLNQQKRRFQWIDLLKPEEEAVGMITAALCDLPSVRTFAETLSRKQLNQQQLRDGFLAGSPSGADRSLSSLPPSQRVPGRNDTAAAVRSAIEALGDGRRPEDLIGSEDDALLMGTLELVGRTIQLKAWPRSLREVLARTLANDQSFRIDHVDDTFTELDDLVGNEATFLVAGHTHLHRALGRQRFPGTYYYNSGTWISLLSIPPALLAPDVFPELELRLRDGRLSELDKPFSTRSGDVSLLRTTRTVVSISADTDGVVRGRLQTVEASSPSTAVSRRVRGSRAASQPAWELADVPASCLPRPGAQP